LIRHTAGILIPLASLRSRGDLGRGDIQSLAPMVDFARAMGHRVIQLLPLDESAPGEASPYSAMSVMAIDPIYAGVRGLPGVGRIRISRARAAIGRARTPDSTIVRREKLALLERAYRTARTRGMLDAGTDYNQFAQSNADWLDDYAMFRALKDRFEWRAWSSWPRPLAARDPTAIEEARRELADAIAMYRYWQYILHRQWNEAHDYARAHGVMLGGDLAFSPALDSAEVWANQHDFHLTRTVGAPPDAFNKKGQRWGLPLPNWWAMGEGGFRVLRVRVRRASALYDLVRVDHVVGLYRTYNFGADPDQPGRFTPEHEDEQRRQGEFILGVIKSEARDAEIIAEDLGTIPPWVRESLRAMNIAGYKVMMWEKTVAGDRYLNPAMYPELSLATTGTHDTEPLVIWWREQSADERRRFASSLGLAEAIGTLPILDADARIAILSALYSSPARLVVLPIQDLFGWSARINRPGTVGGYNWKWRLPREIERMTSSAAIRAIVSKIRAAAVAAGRA
jgi:4-alpha-glucanotransferase